MEQRRLSRLAAVAITLGLVLTSLAALSGIGARPAAAAAPDGSIVLDETGGQVFGIVDGYVEAWDLLGNEIPAFSTPSGARGLALDGRTLYVSTGSKIYAYDADTFAGRGTWELNPNSIFRLGVVDGKVWFTYSVSQPTSRGIGRLDPVTGAWAIFPQATFSNSIPTMVTDPAQHRFHLRDEVASGAITTYDVSSGSPVVVGPGGLRATTGPCADGSEKLISADGNRVWMACGPDAALAGWVPGRIGTLTSPALSTARDLLTLSPDGRLAYAPMVGAYPDPDLVLFARDGDTFTQLNSYNWSNYGLTGGSVVFSADGRRVFILTRYGLSTWALSPPSVARSQKVTFTPTTATVTWAAPTTTGNVTPGYDLTVERGGVETSTVHLPPGTTSHTFTGLDGGVPYRFRVTATNQIGDGPPAWTTPITLGLPSAPRSSVASPGPASAELTWLPPTSDNGSPITGYVVTPYIGTVAQPAIELTSPVTSHVVTDLIDGTSYSFRIWARNANGIGPNGTTGTIIAGSPDAPARPDVVAGDRSATVSWTPPTSDNGDPITSYRLVWSSTSVSGSLTTTETTAQITGLDPRKDVDVNVLATNSRGNGPYSPIARVTIPASAPTPRPR